MILVMFLLWYIWYIQFYLQKQTESDILQLKHYIAWQHKADFWREIAEDLH